MNSCVKNSICRASEELRRIITDNPDLPILFVSEFEGYCSSFTAEMGVFLECECLPHRFESEVKFYMDRADFERDFEDYLEDEYSEKYEDSTYSEWREFIHDKVAEYDKYWRKCVIVTAKE